MSDRDKAVQEAYAPLQQTLAAMGARIERLGKHTDIIPKVEMRARISPDLELRVARYAHVNGISISAATRALLEKGLQG